MVEKELEAMSKAATERFSSRSAQLAHLTGEYSNVSLGQRKTKEKLNGIPVRFPKSGDVKG